MRLTVLALLIGILQGFSAESYAQLARLNLNVKNSTVKEVLNQIEEQSEFFFLYNSKLVDVDRQVNVNVKDQNITEVLELIFSGTNTNYQIVDRQIVLTTGNLEFPAPAGQSQKNVTGKVSDRGGLPLPGVTVVVKGSVIGTITASDGTFTLAVPASADVLQFSFIGMRTVEVAIRDKSTFSVVMEMENIGIEEVVAIGYGTQKKVATTAAVAAVKGDELVGSPVANINNSIVGRLSGVLSFQNSGEPGNDASTLRIRGVGTTGNANALIVIDGIPQGSSSISNINPDEVESVTVLKDAAAVAPYGIGGANGVILITTKRGQQGKISLKYDGYYGIQQPTVLPEFLDAYGYANALNIANENVGNPKTFTDEALQKFKDGSDPDHYPNTDWVNEIINFQAPITKHNLSFTGGSERIRFFSSIGYLYQEGVVSEINYDRYNLLLNVDADVTNTTVVSLDLSGNRRNDNNPGSASGTGLFTDVTEIPPIYPIRYSNGLPAHAMLPSISESGYSRTVDNALNARLQVEQKIPFVPGLKVKGVFGYNIGYSFDKAWGIPFTFYKLNAQEEFAPQPAGPVKPQLSQSFGESRQQIVQGYLTYEKTFNKHDIKLLGVYEGKNGLSNSFSAARVNYELYVDELSLGSSDKNNFNNSGSSSSSAQSGWVYRVDYAYAARYLIQLSGRYDGHYYFAPGKRYSFFPSVSLGWRLSEEKFIKDNYDWIDNLKLRASYGVSGNLAGGAFQYLTSYQTRNSYIFGGTAPYQVLGIYESAQANKNITWETAKKTDIGLDALLFKGKIDFSLDLFTERRSDMLLSPSAVVPAEYGIGLSQVNAGIMENKGFDINLGIRENLGKEVRLNASLNITYAKNKLIETFETAATFNNPNRRKTGRPLDTRFGLEALGLYQTDDFGSDGKLIAGLPVPSFGPVKPGDIKYADIAGAPDASGKITGPDGKIDINDYKVIGNPLFPKMIYGLNLDLQWRGIDLTTLWQGAAITDTYLENEMASPFFNGAKIFKEQTDYWTPENPNATFPRLTPNAITSNTQPSSFWIRDGSYLRLKNLELGYRLPAPVIKMLTIQSLRVFVSGQNLLTFSHLKFLDPELTSGRARYYFQQRVIACGVNVVF